MIIDTLTQYSKAQALAATGASTNSLDHGLDRDIGIGEPMAVCFTVDVAFSGTNFQATLQASPNSNLSSPVNVVSSQVFTVLAAGARFYLVVPPDANWDRYSQVNYTITAGTITITANLVPLKFAQADQYGPSGFAVQ